MLKYSIGMVAPNKYIIKKGNEETDEDVLLTDRHLKMLLLLAQGYTQRKIAEKISRGKVTAHNIFTLLNEITGSHNPQDLVGWSFKYAVLLPVDRKIIVNPNLEIFEK